jgi:hypothetical protein
MTVEEENNFFICEIPSSCELLQENIFKAKPKNYNCTMKNSWTRKALKYPTETDTSLSQAAMKILEKVEPNKERNEAIYKIFNRVWTDVMPQGLKYLDEESGDEIINGYKYLTTKDLL